jgi:protein-L-isoaspartate O-methyltransferase
MLTQEHNIPVLQKSSFEEQYLPVRNAEQRLYSDEVVRMLPACAVDHPHAAEWLHRSRSAFRLIQYLQTNQPGRILETGCGNGWLANLIATSTTHTIVATDINQFELEQAKRLFHQKNLQFICADGNEAIPGLELFDHIVFAASIQYFSSLSSILNRSLERLTRHGEIHILDTRFYKSYEVAEARERTRRYYLSLGYPQMISNYFHHTREALQPFRPEFLFNPFSIISRLTRSANEFPWIRIRKSRQKL